MRMTRKATALAVGLALSLVPAFSVGAAPADPFRGTYVSTDVDGSDQHISFGGAHATRRVTLFDHLATVACDPAQPLTLKGSGTIDGDELDAVLSWRCRDGTTDTAAVTFADNGDGTLTDSTGVVWSRR